MQPYFIPYAGYFRLFLNTDLFVIYDCVQFPRRGWVHRNRLPNANGEPGWLTLPLAHCPVETPIAALEFAPNAENSILERLGRFPCIDQEFPLFAAIKQINENPTKYIYKLLEISCKTLHLPFNVTRSSELRIPPEIKGRDRILEICRRFGATKYINAPGGRTLYDPNDFRRRGIFLSFLPDYTGNKLSILYRLCKEPPQSIRHEICKNC